MEDDSRRLARLRPNLLRRALICDLVRHFFRDLDFLEVETPIRVPVIAPEPYIIPVRSEDWFLSTSPELHMKRMLAAGYEKLFQFSRCFRRGERGRWHNPEFTMLEWYRAGADYVDIIHDTELLVTGLAASLGSGNTIRYRQVDIDIRLPWPRLSVRDAYVRSAGWDPVEDFDPVRFDTDFVTKVLPKFAPDRPTVLIDYPSPVASLARLKSSDPRLAERSEVFFGGLELANAYSELVDAAEQESRFLEAIEQIKREQNVSQALPRRFLEAVPLLPPCGGIALGIDRLVMLLCDAASIDEVIALTIDDA
jgi:lysyl-tRNA synthetase class 2